MPNGLSALMLTFRNTTLLTGASGKPQIKPARRPLCAVAVMSLKVMSR